MKSIKEIKPCPFCGNGVAYFPEYFYPTKDFYCRKCNVYFVWPRTKKENAPKKWNKRFYEKDLALALKQENHYETLYLMERDAREAAEQRAEVEREIARLK